MLWCDDMNSMRRVHGGLLRRSPASQSGITAIGFIILFTFVGVIAFGALRLTPIYLNYMKVVGVIDGVKDEFEGQNTTSANIRRSVSRRFGVDSVGVIHHKDVTVTAVDGGLEVAAVYDHVTPFFANISFSVHFDKTVIVRR